MIKQENMNFPIDTEEVKDAWNDIAMSKPTAEEAMEIYNTMLAVCELIAESIGAEADMPYMGYPGLLH